jgi:hypothetical protein
MRKRPHVVASVETYLDKYINYLLSYLDKNLAGTELVPELQTHTPNWFPPEKVILLGIAKLVPV